MVTESLQEDLSHLSKFNALEALSDVCRSFGGNPKLVLGCYRTNPTSLVNRRGNVVGAISGGISFTSMDADSDMYSVRSAGNFDWIILQAIQDFTREEDGSIRAGKHNKVSIAKRLEDFSAMMFDGF